MRLLFDKFEHCEIGVKPDSIWVHGYKDDVYNFKLELNTFINESKILELFLEDFINLFLNNYIYNRKKRWSHFVSQDMDKNKHFVKLSFNRFGYFKC